MMFAIPILGNMSALKSLRVLRALKTVTVARGTPSSALSSPHSIPFSSFRPSRPQIVLILFTTDDAGILQVCAQSFSRSWRP